MQEVDGDGTVTLMACNANGQMTSRIEAFGTLLERETTWHYDDPSFPAFPTLIERPSTTGDPFDFRRTSITYDAEGNATLTTVEGVEAGSAFSYTTVTTYNGAGQPLTIDPPGYDTAGRLTSIELKADALPTSHGERTFYQLDGYGHRVREEQQRWDGAQWVTEAATELHYSTRCFLDRRVEGAGAAAESATEYSYDCDGSLERVWDANHPSNGQTAPASTVYGYDELDRLTSTTRIWGGAGGGNVVTTYGYDVQDHLTSLTDAEGNTTTWTYSDRDLLTQELSPASGATSFTYNEHGATVTRTDARGVTKTQTVDDEGR